MHQPSSMWRGVSNTCMRAIDGRPQSERERLKRNEKKTEKQKHKMKHKQRQCNTVFFTHYRCNWTKS